MARTLTFLAALPIVLGLNAPGAGSGYNNRRSGAGDDRRAVANQATLPQKTCFTVRGVRRSRLILRPRTASGDPSAAGPIPE